MATAVGLEKNPNVIGIPLTLLSLYDCSLIKIFIFFLARLNIHLLLAVFSPCTDTINTGEVSNTSTGWLAENAIHRLTLARALIQGLQVLTIFIVF